MSNSRSIDPTNIDEVRRDIVRHMRRGMVRNGMLPSFGDSRVFVVPHSDDSTGIPLDYVGQSQSAEGPTFIHVGVGLTDAQLKHVWAKMTRFPTLTLEQLRAARDGTLDEIQLR